MRRVSRQRVPRLRTLIALAAAALVSSTPVAGQIAAPNARGVAMGHVHFVVRDLGANERFWTALGGVKTRAGDTSAFAFPGLLILLTPGAPIGDGTGEVVDHVAFRVRSLADSLAAVKAAGFKVEPPGEVPNTGRAYTPDGYKIELFDAVSESPRFFPDAGPRDSDFERHMETLTAARPIVSQHIHYYLPEGVESAAKAWYFKLLGGTPGRRLRYEAVDLPGINLNFSIPGTPTTKPATPTKGRTLDHIGFEVRGLAALCAKLQSEGVRFAAPYAKGRDGIARAMLTDPWGASIELTEGLPR